ncbi:MAG: BsuPI-related putative proteinase inhibitor [Bryobacteraceae bacterium]
MRLILASLPLVAAVTAQTPDYFPLHTGNEWIYRESFARSTSTVVMSITGTQTFNGRVYSVLTGLSDGPVYLRTSETGTLFRFNTNTRQDEVWAEFATAEGGTYRTAVDACNETARVESRDASLKLPAGDFQHSLKIAYPPGRCADAGLTQETFAPYVGLVQRESTTIAGPRRLDLIYARIGGVTVLSEPELTTSLSLDRAVYRRGQAISARLTLRNTQPEPVELNFSSGQRYDMVIRNEKGEQVFQWSIGTLFVAVTGTEKVGPGQRTWVIDADRELPPGRYVAEAWITADGGKRFGAYAGFSITE